MYVVDMAVLPAVLSTHCSSWRELTLVVWPVLAPTQAFIDCCFQRGRLYVAKRPYERVLIKTYEQLILKHQKGKLAAKKSKVDGRSTDNDEQGANNNLQAKRPRI